MAIGTLALLGFSFYAAESFVTLFRERAISTEQEQTRQAVALARARLEAELFRNTYLSDSLANFITLNPRLTQTSWRSVAEKLLEKSEILRNVGIAPNDVISQVYPLEGNEKALGLDFRTLPEQMRTVQRARELQKVYVAGPVNLVQGGVALIARFPIFNDFPRNQDYWGSISVVMDFEKLLTNSGINAINGATVALRRESLQPGKLTAVYGDSAIFNHANINLPLNTPSGEWQLAAQYNLDTTPALKREVMMIRVIAIFATMLITTSILLLFRAYRYSRNAALVDELTGLPNRRYVMGRLHRLVSKGSKPANFAVLLIDLNRFKQVNDSLGHEAGDALLVHVAEHMERAVRAADIVARLGGDEFIVVLHRISEKHQAEAVIEKLQQHVESQPLDWHEEDIHPSISVGYAVCYGQDTSVKELLARADNMMYETKRERGKTIESWR